MHDRIGQSVPQIKNTLQVQDERRRCARDTSITSQEGSHESSEGYKDQVALSVLKLTILDGCGKDQPDSV